MDASSIQQAEAGLYCGGQPGEAEFATLAAQGVPSLINLRPPGEFDASPAAAARG